MASVIAKISDSVRSLLNRVGLSSRFAGGGAWLGAGNASEHGLRLVRNMLVARLIAPESLGQMAIIFVLSGLFESFTQIGIREAIIHSPKGSENSYLNNAWWVSFIRGIGLYITAIVLLPFAVQFFDDPEILGLARLVFLSMILNGAMSPRAYAALKEMKFRRWVILYHGGALIGVICTIVLAFVMKNVWALAIGFVIESVCRCVLSFVLCPFVPRFTIEREGMKALFRFMRGMFGLPIIVFLYNNLDIFFVGKMFSKADLGLYKFAVNLAVAPTLLYSGIVSTLLLSSFAEIQDDKDRLANRVTRAARMLTIFIFPIMALLAAGAGPILSLVYGEKFAVMAVPYAILCASVALSLLGLGLNPIFFAMGRPELDRIGSIVRLVVLGVLIFPLMERFGLEGAALASLCAALSWVGVNLYRLKLLIGLHLGRFFVAITPGLGIAAVIGAFVIALK